LSDERRSFLEGALSYPETLKEHLLWQLRLEPVSGELRRLCELLIQNLNDDGFHIEPVDILLENENPTLLDEALKLVQSLDPVGTCTADFRQSLSVQIQGLKDAPDGIEDALSYLELFQRGKITEAAKRMGRTVADASRMFEIIRQLSPFPGRRFASGTIRYVVPDIQVVKKDGEFIIILNEEEIPLLGISPFFLKVADNAVDVAETTVKSAVYKKHDKPVRDFALENIKEARWFINSINQRNHTLLRVCRALVEFQRTFFNQGPKFLAPLTLKDVAGELGVHETTVSRISHGKYVQTEWGIFELRYFFSTSIGGLDSEGTQHSKKSVKEIIKEIIAAEDKGLSDQKIVDILAGRGIALARRTVAKYRNEMALSPSFNR